MARFSSAGLPTLVDLLRENAVLRPKECVYSFLADGDREARHLTYGELDARSRAIGAKLQRLRPNGKRILLLFPPGLDFIVAFFGCLYGGAVAVPAYPPRSRRALPRLRAVARDAGAGIVLSTSGFLTRLEGWGLRSSDLPALRWMAVDDLAVDGSEAWTPPAIDGETLALVQYTSGSTAAPKGVAVSHSNLLHNEEMIRRAFETSESSRVVGWLPLYHDMGLIGNVLQPLYVGARCVLMSPMAFLARPWRWLEAVSRYRATVSGGPSFAYDLCVRRISAEQRRDLDLSCWKVAFNGAEPVNPRVLRRFAETFADCGFRREAFYPCYGLAEATLFVAGGSVTHSPRIETFDASALEQHRVVRGSIGDDCECRDLVSCGRPSMDQEIAIVDSKSRRRLAPGQIGEIWVLGPSVARGYWGLEETTASTFGARIEGESDTRAFLRTGDLGFVDGGDLFITGRLKDLIIIRGRNHHPHDIEESVDRSHPDLRPGCGAAFAVEVGGEERLVVAWEILRHVKDETRVICDAVRRAVAEDHGLRIYEVVLLRTGTLPKTSSGKVRRQACAAAYRGGRLKIVDRSRRERASDLEELTESGWFPRREAFQALETADRLPLMEAYLRQEIGHVLRLPAAEIGGREPLVGLGLDSLAAVELKQRLEATMEVQVSLPRLLEDLDLETLTRELVERLQATRKTSRLAPLTPVPRDSAVTLSFAQERLWFLHRLQPESPAYNLSAAVVLRGTIDVPALVRAFAQIVARHEILRTTFGFRDGQTVQLVAGSQERLLAEVDLTGLTSGLAALAAQRLAALEAARPFDLETGPLLRTVLLRTGAMEHWLLVQVHHIVADGWSLEVMVRELSALYAAFVAKRASPLEPLSAQYADFVHWQRSWLTGERLDRQIAFWRTCLENLAEAPEWPADRPRPRIQSLRGRCRGRSVSTEQSAELRALSRSQGVTLFATLFAALSVVLARWSGSEDFVVGTPIAGRNRFEFKDLIGFFANTLALRADLTAARRESCSSLVRRLFRSALEAYAHPDVPFDRVVEELGVERDLSRNPLFQIMLLLERSPVTRLHLPGLQATELELASTTTKFDLTLRVDDTATALRCTLEYSIDLFDGVSAERLLRCFEQALGSWAESLERPWREVSLQSAAQRHQMLIEINDTASARDAAPSLPAAYERQLQATPDAVALVFEDRHVTFRELGRRADRWAYVLRRNGVGSETRVGLYLTRSLELVVGLWAILKAGGCYVPLDPSHPRERLRQILNEIRPPVVLTVEGLSRDLAGASDARWVALDAPLPDGPDMVSGPVAGGDHLAYVLYTSGSTGRPKGVMVSHHSVLNLVTALREAVYRDQDGPLRVGLNASLTFDASVKQWAQLLAGSTLILPGDAMRLEARRLLEFLESRRVDVLDVTPTQLRSLREAGSLPPGIRLLIGGESVVDEEWRDLAEDATVSAFNVYGPTECTVDATSAVIAAGALRPSLGRPLANIRVYVLGRGHVSVAYGSVGEVGIGGAGVARGYFARPRLTAERFVPDPYSVHPGQRLYRSGDLGRFLPAGGLEYLGRADRQFKLRGFRIEPGEIEANLVEHPDLREAAVVLHAEEPARQQLVAYVAPRRGRISPEPSEVRSYLKPRLPEYMVPTIVTTLDRLPRTASGKLDREALPAPIELEDGLARLGETPRTPVEKVLAGMMAEVLGRPSVGLDDDFFELGGNSLMAADLVALIQDAFEIDLPVLHVFSATTVAELADCLLDDPAQRQHVESVAPLLLEMADDAMMEGVSG